VQKKKVQKKKVVKKKTKKQKTQVARAPHVDNRAMCFAGAADTPAAFFECDRLNAVTNAFVAPKKQTNIASGLAKSKIINEASKMQGLHARKNRVVLKTYMNVDKNGPVDPVRIPWCAGFVNAVLHRTGFEGTESLMARSFLHYGETTTKPTEGDIVVLKRGRSNRTGHVGFFQGYEWQGSQLYVKVLGGNQSKQVNVAYFPSNLVLSYRRPV
jgi:uncharacterized protein (TIGR02594 family)